MEVTQRIVIVGAGSGGTMLANNLVKALREQQRDDVEVVLVGNGEDHLYQPGLLYVALDLELPAHFHRRQRRLLLPGVHLTNIPAARIDRKEQGVQLADGSHLAYDYLVIATGSHPDLDEISGFRQGAYSFYTEPEALRLRDALRDFRQGRILITIGIPHKCPVAPLEFTLLLDDVLRRQERRKEIEILYTYPIARLHSLEPVAQWAQEQFEQRDIHSEIFVNMEEIDANEQVVHTMEGIDYSYDLLVGIPPHKGAAVIRNSPDLGDPDGWVPTDRKTLQMKGDEHIFVLGDATDLPISKAGSTTHYEVAVLLGNLLRALDGSRATQTYNGKAFCFIEADEAQATYITFDYDHPPQPVAASPLLHWFKAAYNETYWLSLRGVL
ncbi:MAG: NAD(P)/FAD-dependent oxidoreductase [Firmicutes bacterium]|nr:NAD(P)/FAD-dependent oxidoreductase [Bacillota bacterium]